MGLSRTVTEIDGDFSQKVAKFSHPMCFGAPTEGVPLGIGYRRSGSKTRMTGLQGSEKKFDDIISRLNTIHQRDRQMNTKRQQRPRLRIASRGKMREKPIGGRSSAPEPLKELTAVPQTPILWGEGWLPLTKNLIACSRPCGSRTSALPAEISFASVEKNYGYGRWPSSMY